MTIDFANVERMISLAREQVGYREGKTNGSWNNHQKYSPEVPGLEWSQNQAWCSTFVSWLALQSGLSDYYPRTASTDAGALWFKQRKQWSETPQIGAWGFLGTRGDMYHVFLVVGVDATYVYTIEGNTNANGSSQGDGVYANKRLRNSPSIEGYGIPKVPAKQAVKEKPTKKTPLSKRQEPLVKEAIDNFRQIRRESKANKNLQRANKAQKQINEIKANWKK